MLYLIVKRRIITTSCYSHIDFVIFPDLTVFSWAVRMARLSAHLHLINADPCNIYQAHINLSHKIHFYAELLKYPNQTVFCDKFHFLYEEKIINVSGRLLGIICLDSLTSVEFRFLPLCISLKVIMFKIKQENYLFQIFSLNL